MRDSPADRLKKARIEKGYETAKAAAEAFGWNEVTYRAHENGTRDVTLTAARKYALAFGKTPAYILSEPGLLNSAPVGQVQTVPLMGRVSAGDFRYDDGIEPDGETIPAVIRADVKAGAQYAVIVSGNSVNKRIPDGAYAICSRLDAFPGGAQHGQLVHVIRERAGLREHTIKEIRFTNDGAILMPVSTDPKHQEQVKLQSGDDGETVWIEGVVIGVFQQF